MRPLSERVVVAIPARRGSTRLADKMLADVAGRPLIVRTYERVRDAGFDRVLVATDDPVIASVIHEIGGEVVRTGDAPNGSVRVAEATRGMPADVVLNVQGDEPLVPPETLHAVAAALLDTEGAGYEISTGAAPIGAAEAALPQRVKVVVGEGGRALYFSRSPVPHGGPFRVHVGVYGFRPAALQRVAALPPSPLERGERLEQLRWLAHGVPIRVVAVQAPAPSVDTADDLAAVRAIFAARPGP